MLQALNVTGKQLLAMTPTELFQKPFSLSFVQAHKLIELVKRQVAGAKPRDLYRIAFIFI